MTSRLMLPNKNPTLPPKNKGPERLNIVLDDDEPPGSVRSEFADLAIHHPIPSKRRHYNPHTLDNTTDFRSISHKHSDTILEP